jgi:hypothetical protein
MFICKMEPDASSINRSIRRLLFADETRWVAEKGWGVFNIVQHNVVIFCVAVKLCEYSRTS